jgi:hypothetical protein
MEAAEKVRPGKVRKHRTAAKLLLMTINCLFYLLFILWLTVINFSCFSRAQLQSISSDIFVQRSDAVRDCQRLRAHSTIALRSSELTPV